jgi:mannose-6-phosphate isomerase-like protein (cupin superfamily)
MVDLSIRPVRRIVTGHDADCRSVVTFEGQTPSVLAFESVPGSAMTEVWITAETPAEVDSDIDLSLRPVQLLPPANGSIFRIGQIAPISSSGRSNAAQFKEMGAPQAHTGEAGKNPAMHRTATIDYAVVLSGEIFLLLDDGEHKLGPGDCVVQRGTDHGWENRSNEVCILAFILIDAKPTAAGR